MDQKFLVSSELYKYSVIFFFFFFFLNCERKSIIVKRKWLHLMQWMVAAHDTSKQTVHSHFFALEVYWIFHQFTFACVEHRTSVFKLIYWLLLILVKLNGLSSTFGWAVNQNWFKPTRWWFQKRLSNRSELIHRFVRLKWDP